jgi:acyl-[acyl-carrier-protein] desaturase
MQGSSLNPLTSLPSTANRTRVASDQAGVIKSMDGFVHSQLELLKTVTDSWQPSDFLPNMNDGGWVEDVRVLRERVATLSDEALVVLVGNLVTEEALPSYQTSLNRVEGFGDHTGIDQTPWALWSRGWTAEENRHGDVLSRYLYLSGRVDMRSVELTIQNLIRNGFDAKAGNNPYHSLAYTSFQERATKISHINTGRLAESCGDMVLARICATIGGDEARHEEAYKRFFGKIVELDPAGAVIAFKDMMHQRISMPARLMDDGAEHDVFSAFAIVAQRSGVYTTRDYSEVIDHLVAYWNIGSISGLSGEAAEAQELVCGLAARYLQKADRYEEVLRAQPKEAFPWIFNREA